MSKKIIVTGGAGYIGSHTILDLLSSTNYEIISIDNFSNSTANTFDRIEKISGKKVQNLNLDLCNYESTSKALSELDNIIAVVHFAAFKSVPDSVSNPIKYYLNNINSLNNILQVCLNLKINNFIFSSSCSIYGNISNLPVNEETPISIAESPYARTKQLGEEIIKTMCSSNHSFRSVALRYFNPVGAHLSGEIGESPINKPTNLLPLITKTAIGEIKEINVFGGDYDTRDGTCIRDYIHVCDIARAHTLAIEFLENLKNSENNYQIFNLGSGEGTSVLEAINAFEKSTSIKVNHKIVNRREGDVEAIYSDSSKAEKLLKWKPKYSLEEMVKSAWQWEKTMQKGI